MSEDDELEVEVITDFGQTWLNIGAECLTHGNRLLVYEPEVGLMCVDCAMERENE